MEIYGENMCPTWTLRVPSGGYMCAARRKRWQELLHPKTVAEGRTIRWSTEGIGEDEEGREETGSSPKYIRRSMDKPEMVTARSLLVVPVLRLLVSQVVSKMAEWTHSGINEADL